jgi:hypothetical protein
MNKSFLKLSIIGITMGFSLYGWADRPCKPMAQACMEQGYAKDKDLIKNCVLPVVNGEKTIPNTSFTDSQKQACKEKIMQKMQSGKGSM